MPSLERQHRPLARVQAADIEDFIQERLEHGAAATVVRQLDLFRAVDNIATNTWWHVVARHLTDDVRRPSFVNEREAG